MSVPSSVIIRVLNYRVTHRDSRSFRVEALVGYKPNQHLVWARVFISGNHNSGCIWVDSAISTPALCARKGDIRRCAIELDYVRVFFGMCHQQHLYDLLMLACATKEDETLSRKGGL